MGSLLDVPNFKERYETALESLFERRELVYSSISALCVNICGINVAPMTLRAYVDLDLVGNTVLTAATYNQIKPTDAIAFVYRLSPWYARRDTFLGWLARKVIVWRLAHFTDRDALRMDCLCVNKETHEDALAGGGSGGRESIPTHGMASSYVHIFALTYGWNADQTLDTPLSSLYQLLRQIAKANNPDLVIPAPFAEMRGEAMAELRKIKAAKKDKQNG